MKSRPFWFLSSGISMAGLLCWMIMFLAGNDVWHDLGRPDIWAAAGAPYADLRVFLWSFYAMFIVLAAGVIIPMLMAVRGCRSTSIPA